MLTPALMVGLCLAGSQSWAGNGPKLNTSVASWYGEEHRGKLMANGKRFDPDKLTAASWFYPLGTKVQVTLRDRHNRPVKKVQVVITDRGPHRRLVRQGRTIDLAHAAFKELAHPDLGLIPVVVSRVQ